MQAIALDPLTSAVCTLNEIREMTREMLEAESAVAAAVRGQEAAGQARDQIPEGLAAWMSRSTRPWPSRTGSRSWRNSRPGAQESTVKRVWPCHPEHWLLPSGE